jgi:hypothetical protein
LIRDDKTIPASLTRNINSAGGQYEYQKKELNGKFLYVNQSLSNLEANVNYEFNEEYQFLLDTKI